MISITAIPLSRVRTDVLVCFVWQSESLTKVTKQLCITLSDIVLYSKRFTGERFEKRLIPIQGKRYAKQILLVGMGNKHEFSSDHLRKNIAEAYAFIERYAFLSVSFLCDDKHPQLSFKKFTFLLAEISILSLYTFQKHKTKDTKKTSINKIVIVAGTQKKAVVAQNEVVRAKKICISACRARDLINEPPNILTPQTFVREIKKDVKKLSVRTTVFRKDRIKKEKMFGLLAVSSGSAHEPVFLILHYRGIARRSRKRICLVGKGVCFDSGGICLKSAQYMEKMKYDMSGAAVCAQTVLAAARLRLPHEMIALIPLCENSIDGKSYRPGDVIRMSSGLTVEVINTDAEGRVILADALHYAATMNPDTIIDVATLTGAAKVCLGNKAAAVLGNDENLIEKLKAAGVSVGERLWPLPLWDEYTEDLKSTIADLKNIGNKGAGTIIGAAFLSQFVSCRSWAHIDIAATAWEDDGKSYIPKGASGFGVRLLTEYVAQL